MRSFLGRGILSLKDMEREEFFQIFRVTDQLKPYALERRNTDLLKSKTLLTAFYQPSTRTRMATEAAMHRQRPMPSWSCSAAGPPPARYPRSELQVAAEVDRPLQMDPIRRVPPPAAAARLLRPGHPRSRDRGGAGDQLPPPRAARSLAPSGGRAPKSAGSIQTGRRPPRAGPGAKAAETSESGRVGARCARSTRVGRVEV